MKNFYVLIFLLTISLGSKAQTLPTRTFLKTGNITLEDLRMANYNKDTTAAAVILYDAGRSRYDFNNAGEMVVNYDRHLIVKIFKKAGYDLANVAVPLFRVNTYTKESISNLKGTTYNLVDGKIATTKLTDESVFDEKNTYNWITQKLTMPNVKEGSVFEITYRVQSKFIYHLRPWQFQFTVPVIWSEYTTQVPDIFTFNPVFQGSHPFAVRNVKPVDLNTSFVKYSPTSSERKWAMRDIPAVREEPFMNSINNYLSKMEFEISNVQIPGLVYESFNNTWEKINKALLESDRFGNHIDNTGAVKETVKPIIAAITDPEKKALAIYNYVKQNFRYNNIEQLVTTTSLKKTLENRTGNSADINLLLLAMLREAGLEASPVILSTRENGVVNTVNQPNISKFNYVIALVKVADKQLLLDATEPMANPNLLPIRCLNGEGRLVNLKDSRWVPLSPAGKVAEMYYSQLTIGNNNSLKGRMQLSSSGYAALNHRKDIAKKGEKLYIEEIKSRAENLEVEKFKVQNSTSPDEALKVELDINNPGQGQQANIIYLSPFQNQVDKINPFKLESRIYPVDFAAPIEQTFVFNYTIPEGYKLDEQPKNAIVTLPGDKCKFIYSINSSGNTINCMSKINVNNPNFNSEEYLLLKEFFDQVIAKHSEQIVLKKI